LLLLALQKLMHRLHASWYASSVFQTGTCHVLSATVEACLAALKAELAVAATDAPALALELSANA